MVTVIRRIEYLCQRDGVAIDPAVKPIEVTAKDSARVPVKAVAEVPDKAKEGSPKKLKERKTGRVHPEPY